MAKDLFSVPIFFIVFRETIEAGIIVSVLLSFVEQLMLTGRLLSDRVASTANLESSTLLENDPDSPAPSTSTGNGNGNGLNGNGVSEQTNGTMRRQEEAQLRVNQIIKRMRIQIWAGTITGFVIALAIGAAFIAVFYTKVTDLWANTEQIWEGVFSCIAAILIYIMGIAFLRMDRSRIKWRYKLAAAFEKSHSKAIAHHRDREDGQLKGDEDKEGRSGKWALFLLPFVTVLREGLEAVVFVGGVSLNESGTSIPIPAIVGLIAGIIVGYLIYKTGSSATLHWFLVASTSFLFLIGAGLASKGIGFFQYYRFSHGVGGDVSETGDGPGSFQVAGNVWHLTYGNPETGSPTTNGGWQVFNAILGWNNTATLGTILTYVFYWILIIATLIYLKYKEGRVSFFGKMSKRGHALHARREQRRMAAQERSEVEDYSRKPHGDDDGDFAKTGGEEGGNGHANGGHGVATLTLRD